MPRIGHGGAISLEKVRTAREALSALSADFPAAFAAIRPVATRDFDFLFGDLQHEPRNLLPERQRTRDDLVRLGRTMQDAGGATGGGDSHIPAAYTYFGQFVTTTSPSRHTPPTCRICWTPTSHRSGGQR